MKIAFITSVFGNRGNNPVKFQRVEGCDYFLFSDRDQKDFNTNWDVYNISNNPNISNLDCNVRKSRYAKFMGWELLGSMGLNYDFIYYCDVHYSPKSNVDWLDLTQSIINSNTWSQDLHWDQLTQTSGILKECELIINGHRDSKKNMEKTINWFRHNYGNVDLSAPIYFRNGHLGYNTQDELFQKISKEFWKQYTTSDISFRDQPFWNVLLKSYNVKPIDCNFLKKFNNSGTYGNHNCT